MITLAELGRAANAALDGEPAVTVTGIAHDSRTTLPGDLFVALTGQHAEAVDHLDEAIERGAVAVCVTRDAVGVSRRSGVPLLLVDDTRAALADLAAAYYRYPARELQLIGITGTLGKTSTAAFVQAALARGSEGQGVGVVGSLGAGVEGRDDSRVRPVMELAGMTTPDPPALHRALRLLVDCGVRTVVMEVTSHALAQERVRGLRFVLGALTNLVPDEHLEFHGTAEAYLRVKARFFDCLSPGAPLVYNADDALVREMVGSRAAAVGAQPVSVSFDGGHQARDWSVLVDNVRWDERGSHFTLRVRHAIDTIAGDVVPPGSPDISLPLLGVQHVTNAALAATTALVGGASTDEVVESLSAVAPVRRRMEVVRAANPLIIDDTTGNPESMRAVLDTVRPIRRSSLRILFGLRGARGAGINALLADTLALLAIEQAQYEPVLLVLTWSEDAALERDRVTPEEQDAAITAIMSRLSDAPPAFQFFVEPSLQGSVQRVLAQLNGDELVLLLGTQGMDSAADLVREALAGTVTGAGSQQTASPGQLPERRIPR